MRTVCAVFVCVFSFLLGMGAPSVMYSLEGHTATWQLYYLHPSNPEQCIILIVFAMGIGAMVFSSAFIAQSGGKALALIVMPFFAAVALEMVWVNIYMVFQPSSVADWHKHDPGYTTMIIAVAIASAMIGALFGRVLFPGVPPHLKNFLADAKKSGEREGTNREETNEDPALATARENFKRSLDNQVAGISATEP